MGRKQTRRRLAVVARYATNPNAPTLEQLQMGEAAGVVASLLVALVRQRQRKETPERV